MPSRAALFAATALVAFLAACRPGPPGGRTGQGVLLVAVDGLRADHVGALGYDRDTTPNLDGLLAQGAAFERTFASAPLPIPAHAALVTGCDSFVAQRSMDHERPDAQRWNVPNRAPRLAVEFLAAGFRTVLIADGDQFNRIEGFGRGFQDVMAFEPDRDWRPREAGLSENGRRLAHWLSGLDDDESWFAYVHARDLERAWRFPDAEMDTWFAPRAELKVVPPVAQTDPALFAIPRSRWVGGSRALGHYEARYDGTLRWLDRQLGLLLDRIDGAGRLDDTLVCVVGAHGVQFGEAGLWLVAGLFSPADLGVPLVIRPSRGRRFEPGQVRAEVASTTDVAPTLLELAGLPIPAGMHGRSLVPLLDGGEEPPRRYVTASCGLLPGYAVMGERLTLEVLHPGIAQPEIVDMWYGDGEVHQEWTERLYDRGEEPYPPLGVGLDRGETGAADIRTAGGLWVRRIELTRRALQAGGIFASERLTAEERADLERLGYLGEGGR